MKQEERRKKTIQLLLNSTKELIKEKGCHAITMNDIMKKSNLSKGAIFHYVKSKDEIFAWVLQEELEKINEEFFYEVNQGKQNFDGPLDRVIQGLSTSESQLITNQVLLYLWGKENDPLIKKALQQYYDHAFQNAKQWIESGQEHGVIQSSVNSGETAELFVLLMLGYRMRRSISERKHSFEMGEIKSLMTNLLKA